MKNTYAQFQFGDPTIADAILGRLVRNAYKIELTGPTRRPEVTKTHRYVKLLASLRSDHDAPIRVITMRRNE
jgi:hypothetical protein